MVNWGRRKYSREEFAEAWLSSSSIAQVAKKLGCNTTGGGYITLKMATRELGLDDSHMTGQGWNIGWPSNPSRARVIALPDVLIKNSTYTTIWRLKRRLLQEGLLTYKCYLCGFYEKRDSSVSIRKQAGTPPAALTVSHALTWKSRRRGITRRRLPRWQRVASAT
jgi:hypothetical protein